MGSTQSTWEFKSENLRENNQAKKKTKEEKMALNINTFSPFSMRSAFDNSFFSNRWNDDWMVPSRNLDNQFKELRSLFNKEEAKVEEDNTRMEVRIDASKYKPEELKVFVQSGRLLVEGRHEEKKEDGRGFIQRSLSRRYTLPKEAEVDKMVSNLSSEGILVITTPKSSPALTDATHKAK